MNFVGMDITSPLNRIKTGAVAVCTNVRAYMRGGVMLRTLLSGAIVSLGAVIQTIRRVNDTTPVGPPGGFSWISMAGTTLYCTTFPGGVATSTAVATGFSGKPISMVTYRPDTSVQPWVYTGDTSQSVVISASGFGTTGMVKVRSDGLTFKAGIKEPSVAPIIGINNTVVTQWLTLPATAPPWTNQNGANPLQNYGGIDVQPPFAAILSTPTPLATVVLTVTGTATVDGVSHAPGDAGSTAANHPGAFIAAAEIVVFAFTDGDGNIIAQSAAPGAPPVIGNVGAGATLTVPTNAVQLQIGINGTAGSFVALNSGSYLIQATVSTSAVSPVTAITGLITAYIWGDSPHASSSASPIATYIWRNASDTGTGIIREITTASATGNNNSLILNSLVTDPTIPQDGTVPVPWDSLDNASNNLGPIDLFAPALESDGYQDFNCALVGNLFFPKPGKYAVQVQYKDQMLMGIGGGVQLVGSVTQTGGGAGTTTLYPPIVGTLGQNVTMANALPLMDAGRINGTTALGTFQTDTFNIQVPALGVYPFEIDWDYWYHSGRSLIVTMSPTPAIGGGMPPGVALIPPLPQNVRQDSSYAYVYRSSDTGAMSNPSPTSTPEITPVLANTVSSAWSSDPQVDKVDYYRQDTALTNYTYIGTGPNDGLGGIVNGVVMNTPITDNLSDTAAAANPTLQFDNFEPVPSIDTPKAGMVTITSGVITWKSGDQFNTRWLPGTIILIGSPTQTAYTLVTRPTSTTTMVIPDVPDTIGSTAAGLGVPYNIAEPILANQPLPYLWGPTDNINFAFGVGDPLRPGTLYWSKGSNLDSWPDTNQQDVTDPSETLVNGAMSGGLGVLFSIKRAWLIEPNFFNAEATATGTVGSPWTLQMASISRGLYIPRCLAVEGSGLIFFRVEDGIHVSQRGSVSESITDGELYPLFSHEGSTPTPVIRNGITIYPPDDTQPLAQQFNIFAQYLYWDFIGTDGNRYTLVFDIETKGWVLDKYSTQVSCHSANEGESSQGILAGCTDGTIRQMLTSGATEINSGVLVTASIGGQGWMHCGSIDIEYSSTANTTLTLIAVDTQNGSYGPAPITLPSTNGVVQKLDINPGPNKWKLSQFRFDITSPSFQLYLEGTTAMCKPWGSTQSYTPIQMFAPNGGLGGQP